MDYSISGVMESDLLGIQISTGQVVPMTERVLVGVVSDWDWRLFPGSTGSKSQWH